MTSILETVATTIHAAWGDDAPTMEVGAKKRERNGKTPTATWQYASATYNKAHTSGAVTTSGGVSTALLSRNAAIDVYLWGASVEAVEGLILGLLRAMDGSELITDAIGETWPTQQRPEMLAKGELAIVRINVQTDVTKGEKPVVVILSTSTTYDYVVSI